MKKHLHRTLIFMASCGALFSGVFWFLSANIQKGVTDIPATSQLEAMQALISASADMNYWAAIGALFAGSALVLSALFDD